LYGDIAKGECATSAGGTGGNSDEVAHAGKTESTHEKVKVNEFNSEELPVD